MKIISQSFINPLWPSPKNVDGNSFGWVFPIYCILLATLVFVLPESESINCGTYILNTTNLAWKKVNQAFAITIKRVVYLINFLGHKTLNSVNFVMLQQLSHLLFPQENVSFSLRSGYTLALTSWFLKL